MNSDSMHDVLIVGAGIAGLIAATELQTQGKKVTLLDKGRLPGGRLATRYNEEGQPVFDYGAQFVTARDEWFAQQMKNWIEAKAAVEWGRGFSNQIGVPAKQNGYSRFRGYPGMQKIADHLAKNLNVRNNQKVIKIEPENNFIQVQTDQDNLYTARHMILTMPVPQSLELLQKSRITLLNSDYKSLQSIVYAPCLAILATLQGPSGLPSPGALHLQSEPIDIISDNTQKFWNQPLEKETKTSKITIHAGPKFSEGSLDQKREEINKTGKELVPLALPYLASPVSDFQTHFWRYARPVKLHPERCFSVTVNQSMLVFAGDAFFEPRVEGAALSGKAAADLILQNT